MPQRCAACWLPAPSCNHPPACRIPPRSCAPRLGRTWVLVATDLIGRGMDFAGVNTVISFDFPRSTTDYIHRIGRTGRAGQKGASGGGGGGGRGAGGRA